MATKLMRRVPFLSALVVGVVLAAPACASHGRDLEGVTVSRGRNAVIQGEVRSVDHRRSYITIRERYGRSYQISYDRKTRVIDGKRRYSINALDRGDRVRVWISYDRRGTPWVKRIEVHDVGSRDRRVATPRLQILSGSVIRLDTRRNAFTLEHGRKSRIVVRVPSRLQRDDARRVQRLRKGDRVSIYVREIGRGTVELIRFR